MLMVNEVNRLERSDGVERSADISDVMLTRSVDTLRVSADYIGLPTARLRHLAEAKALNRITRHLSTLSHAQRLAELHAWRSVRALRISFCLTAAIVEHLSTDTPTPLSVLALLPRHGIQTLIDHVSRPVLPPADILDAISGALGRDPDDILSTKILVAVRNCLAQDFGPRTLDETHGGKILDLWNKIFPPKRGATG